MDASASPRVNTEFDNLCGINMKFDYSAIPANYKQKNCVVKYTRLPDFDLNSRALWGQQNYSVEPRLRRIVTIEDPMIETTRSLKPDVVVPKTMTSSIISRRKIVTIEENDEHDLHPKFSRTRGKASAKSSNRSIITECSDEKLPAQRTTAKLSNSSKILKDTKLSIKNNIPSSNKNDLSVSKFNIKGKNLKNNNESVKVASTKSRKEDTVQYTSTSKVSTSKSVTTPNKSDRDVYIMKQNLNPDWKSLRSNKPPENIKPHRSPINKNRTKVPSIVEAKPLTRNPIIHVPLDRKYQNANFEDIDENEKLIYPGTVDCETEMDLNIINMLQDKKAAREDVPKTSDCYTQIDREIITTTSSCQSSFNYDKAKMFDSLDIPNVNLTKESDKSKDEQSHFFSKSLPNIRVPSLNRISLKEMQNEQIKESLYCKNSYIISRATLTYTSKQKIDFHVVENGNDTSQSDMSPVSVNYPMNVVSVYKKELEKRKYNDTVGLKKKDKENNKTRPVPELRNDVMSLNCSYVFDIDKLKKPSDIIRTIKVNNCLIQNGFICEQFQRELSFIDSFFESLQYLENCSLSEKCLTNNTVENWIGNNYDLKNLEYGSFLSKLENGFNLDDKETMASESLCLLNLLIRDEQRRAKKLLFVLKMREDALKDFTKSQILWLENKKKQENIDIPTLKKKQRGALLKLQHECGEMQRMRKALLTLSEKRKTALMKTKKNIEWKLQNNVDVEQIILSKKKLKRNTLTDRNIAPLKCFDLSSSGCDESTSRPKLSTPILLDNIVQNSVVASAEKCIQTGDSILATVLMDQSTNTDENFVVVDGGYLNILFNNLSLPQIFSSGKQYEVNEEALKNIVSSTNNRPIKLDTCDVIEKLMQEIKDVEPEKSSTPSTARSLVEEFDLYYKGLLDEEGLLNTERQCEAGIEVFGLDNNTPEEVEKPECVVSEIPNDEAVSKPAFSVSVGKSYVYEPLLMSVETQSPCDKEVMVNVAGPLPIPAGAAAVVDPLPTPCLQDKPSFTSSDGDCSSSISSHLTCVNLLSPVHNEAEELRRQQLAIEQEIKALEQQQSQLLVVREIPDKPPPPYTPPSESRPPKPPRGFRFDEAAQEKIKKCFFDPDSAPETDHFDMFIKDFCKESMNRHECDQSDKFWDTCSSVPPKPPFDREKLEKRTVSDFKEVLTGVQPNIVSGVGARRCDHIDDILFAEWRRCEPEWTSLHADEVVVKNQLFESIFQKVLTETIDEYKRTVLGEN